MVVVDASSRYRYATVGDASRISGSCAGCHIATQILSVQFWALSLPFLPVGESEMAEADATLHRLCPSYAVNINSPLRHVRTRIYFTSESHIHALVNVLRYCHIGLDNADPLVCESGQNILWNTPELDYMSHIVFRMYENQQVRKGAFAASAWRGWNRRMWLVVRVSSNPYISQEWQEIGLSTVPTATLLGSEAILMAPLRMFAVLLDCPLDRNWTSGLKCRHMNCVGV